jgi:hypothetical protein
MADTLVFMDGFDYYAAGDVGRKYSTGSINSMVTGRFGGQAASSSSSAFQLEEIFTATSQSWRIGFALNLQSQTGSTFTLLSIKDGSSQQVGLSWIASTRNFQFNRNGTLIGSAGSTNLSTSQWYWIEVYFTIKDSITSGECRLYINGVQEINLAGASDTKNTSNAYGDRFSFFGAAFWTFYLDDLFVYQMDVTASPTFLGEHRIQTLNANGNGNYSQFDGSDGNQTNNYLLVDETVVSDSDYVESADVGDRDSYTFTNLSGTIGAIVAVQISAHVKKDDAGAKTGKLFYRISSTDYDGADFSPSSSFLIFESLNVVSPATATAWTQSEVDGLEAGIKVQA